MFSGDTRATEAMVRHARGADVLVHEAYDRKMMAMAARAVDELDLNVDSAVIGRIAAAHTDTLSLAGIAERAEVERLVVTHMIPPIPPNALAEHFFAEGMRSIYDGELILARDGMRIRVSGP